MSPSYMVSRVLGARAGEGAHAHGRACTARGRLKASVHMADRAKAAAARAAAPARRARGPEWWPSVYPFQLNQPPPSDKQTVCCGRPAAPR